MVLFHFSTTPRLAKMFTYVILVVTQHKYYHWFTDAFLVSIVNQTYFSYRTNPIVAIIKSSTISNTFHETRGINDN